MKLAIILLCVPVGLVLAGCPGGQIQPPAMPTSQSEVTEAGLLQLSATVEQSGAYEITSVFCDYVIGRTVPVTEEPGPTGPNYGPDGELIEPVVANATFDGSQSKVSHVMSLGEMTQLGDRDLFYRWVVEYRLQGGTDIATARSDIFRTGLDEASGDGVNDVVVVF